MDKSLKDIDADIDKIELVFSKLKEKQNEEVYDKLCEKCDNVVTRVSNLYKSGGASIVSSFISLLFRLLGLCNELRNYRDYLDTVDNIQDNTNSNTNAKAYKLTNPEVQ